MKRLLKRVIKRRIRAFGSAGGSLPRILTYHSVGDRPHPMNVTPENFEAQMRWLAGSFRVISVADALAGVKGVAITFDDGYRDNLVNAAPVLRRLDIPATVFVVTQRMGGFLDHDRPEECARLMTWDEARAWRGLGLEVGGHTRTHARLRGMDAVDLMDEVDGCRVDLEGELGAGTYGFAYPFGSSLDYDDVAVRAVRGAGFGYGLSNRYGRVDRDRGVWEVQRIWIDDSDHLDTFRAKVDGRMDSLRLLDSRAGIKLRRALNWLIEGGTTRSEVA